MIRRYQVTAAVAALDPNPTIKIFDDHYEMEEWIQEEMTHRMDWIVQHSPYSISEEEYAQLEQEEYTLFQCKEI